MDKNDLRILKTEKQLKESLFTLIKEKGFDKITVRDLTTHADICRSTFYAHYEDKFELMSKIENNILDNFQKLIYTIKQDYNNPENISENIYTYIYDNKYFFELFTKNYDTTRFENNFYFIISTLFDKNFFVNKFDIPENYISSLLVGIYTSLIDEWIKTDLKETPSKMAELTSKVLKNMSDNFI